MRYLDGGDAMPRYYFDIKDGHRSVDPLGRAFKNDHDAIERAKAVAIVVSIDQRKSIQRDIFPS